MPPLMFDDEQAVAIAVALQLATVAGAGIQDGAARALNTIRQVMPSRLRRRIDTLPVTAIEPPTARPDSPADGTVLAAIGTAVHARDVLRFDYASATAGPQAPPRRVEPAAANSSRAPGPGPAWLPHSAGSTPASRSPDPQNSRPLSHDSPAATQPRPHDATSGPTARTVAH
jgi:hypothetical protein